MTRGYAAWCGAALLLWLSVGAAPAQGNLDELEREVAALMDAARAQTEAGNKQAARDLLLQVTELDPENWKAFYQIGELSIAVERYGDAIFAYEQASLGLTVDELLVGRAYLVLANYEKGYEWIDRALTTNYSNERFRAWRLVAAFGRGGWEAAVQAYRDAPYDFSDNASSASLEGSVIFDMVSSGLAELRNRSRNAGHSYATLTHLSLLNEALDEAVRNYWGRDFRRYKWNTVWEAIDVYRRLPVKPLPPPRAVEKAAEAEQYVRAGRFDYTTFDAAAAATTIAPWWPEARYNLAVLARGFPFGVNYKYLTEEAFNGAWMAAQEFTFYLALAPRGPKAKEICDQLQAWRQSCVVK